MFWLSKEQPPQSLVECMAAAEVAFDTRPQRGREPAPRMWWVTRAPGQAKDKPDLRGYRIGVVHADAGAADGLAQALRTAGAEVALVSDTTHSLDRLHMLGPDALVVVEGDLRGLSQGTLHGVWRHPTLRWTPVLVCREQLFGAGGVHAPELRHLAYGIIRSVEPARQLAAKLTSTDKLVLPLSQLGPVRPLMAFEGSELGLRATLEAPGLRVEVDMAEGIVAGAQGSRRGEPPGSLLGSAALLAMLEATTGLLRVRKVERPAQTNIMAPLEAALVAALAERPEPEEGELPSHESGVGARAPVVAAGEAPARQAADPSPSSTALPTVPKQALFSVPTRTGMPANDVAAARQVAEQVKAAAPQAQPSVETMATVSVSDVPERPEAVTQPLEKEHLLEALADQQTSRAGEADEETLRQTPEVPPEARPPGTEAVAAPAQPPQPPPPPAPVAPPVHAAPPAHAALPPVQAASPGLPPASPAAYAAPPVQTPPAVQAPPAVPPVQPPAPSMQAALEAASRGMQPVHFSVGPTDPPPPGSELSQRTALEELYLQAAAVNVTLAPPGTVLLPRWVLPTAAGIILAGLGVAAWLLAAPAAPEASASITEKAAASEATVAAPAQATAASATAAAVPEQPAPAGEAEAQPVEAAEAAEEAADPAEGDSEATLAEEEALDDEAIVEDDEEELADEELDADEAEFDEEDGEEEPPEENEIEGLGDEDADVENDTRAKLARAKHLVNEAYGLAVAKRYAEARRAYLRALRLKPNYPRALGGLTEVYLAQRRYHGALRTAKRALRLRPGRAAYYLHLGDAHAGLREMERAKMYWRKASRRGAKSEARQRLSRASRRRHR